MPQAVGNVSWQEIIAMKLGQRQASCTLLADSKQRARRGSHYRAASRQCGLHKLRVAVEGQCGQQQSCRW